MSEEAATTTPARVLYVTDLTYEQFDPADLCDVAYLLRSPEHALNGVCLMASDGDGERTLDALNLRVNGAATTPVAYRRGSEGLLDALREAEEPVSLVVTAGFAGVAEALAADRALFRRTVARLFLVGGHANDYALPERAGERIPIDPRLKERNPERFDPAGDPRVADPEERAALGTLLTSGEGVIWLPRDVCLWRYAAPQILADGGPVCEFLLRELFFANLRALGPDADRYDAADAPALLSALPALLLARHPDPTLWLRLFRAVLARVEVSEAGDVTAFTPNPESPNLYAVVAIDGRALGKLLTARLRDRSLAGD